MAVGESFLAVQIEYNIILRKTLKMGFRVKFIIVLKILLTLYICKVNVNNKLRIN